MTGSIMTDYFFNQLPGPTKGIEFIQVGAPKYFTTTISYFLDDGIFRRNK